MYKSINILEGIVLPGSSYSFHTDTDECVLWYINEESCKLFFIESALNYI